MNPPKIYSPTLFWDLVGIQNGWFRNKPTSKKIIKEEASDFPLHSLVLDIEANNDADVEIIFDERNWLKKLF